MPDTAERVYVVLVDVSDGAECSNRLTGRLEDGTFVEDDPAALLTTTRSATMVAEVRDGSGRRVGYCSAPSEYAAGWTASFPEGASA